MHKVHESSAEAGQGYRPLVHDEYHTSMNLWKLKPADSVYFSTMVLPLIRSQEACCKRAILLTATIFILVINCCLQFIVMVKIEHMSVSHRDDQLGKLFADKGLGGLCVWREAGELPYHSHLKSQPSKSIGCGMLTATLLPHLALIDQNNNGMWTFREAQDTDAVWEHKYHKESCLSKVNSFFLKAASKGEMLAQAGSTKLEWAKATDNFTAIPIEWLEKEKGKLELCSGLSPELCGNFEVRGILEAKLGKVGEHETFKTRDDRVDACEETMRHYCKGVFGQLYRVYVNWQEELCGDMSRAWNDNYRVVTTTFSKVRNYIISQGAITRSPYIIFLTLILVIWWMTMFTELRRIIDFWVIIVFSPLAPNGNQNLCDISEDEIRINAIPWWIRIWAVPGLIVRTMICLRLSKIGSDFLINADDYSEAVLNSVALAFLIEIDEMLYSAVTSSMHKEMIAHCMPMDVPMPYQLAQFFYYANAYIPQMISYTFVLISIVGHLVYSSYNESDGKYMIGRTLGCLCQVEGSDCIGAQILGGLDTLPSHNLFAG